MSWVESPLPRQEWEGGARRPELVRIALDTSFLVLNRGSGMRTYVGNLLGALVGQDTGDEFVCWYSYFRGSRPGGPRDPRVRHCVFRFPRRLLESSWLRLGLPPIDLFTGPVDVFHSVHLIVPPQRRGVPVLTVHDLREFRLPRLYPHLQRFRSARIAMARRARRVIAVSHSTRRDVLELMGLDPDRVRVIHNGLDPRYRHPPAHQERAAVRSRLGLTRPYVLVLGSRDPRKGMEDALEAFRRADLEGLDLVVAGSLSAEGERRAAAAGLGERLRLPGHLEDEALHALMAGAQAFLFPSLYEGFGLPVLEAMACGTPVVACHTSSLPEVAGDAALLVPPGDPPELARALERVVADGELRRNLIERGFQRCRLFSWERAARETLAVYREAAEG